MNQTSRRDFLAALVGIPFAAPSFADAQGATLRAGTAKVDITPDVKTLRVPLGGYAARKDAPATGVHDPIYARAVVLSDGRQMVRLVSVDLCFVPASLRDAVFAHLNIAAPNLFLCATHTHSAPDPLAMHAGNTIAFPGFSKFNPALRDVVARGIVEAVVQAESRSKPATLQVNSKHQAGLNRNRRGDKILDDELSVVRIKTADTKSGTMLVNFAAHPTIYSEKMREISADWCGQTTVQLDAALGGANTTLFLNGAEGDASPVADAGQNDDERVKNYAQRMTNAVLELEKEKVTPQPATLGYLEHVFALPPRKPNGLFYAAAASLGVSIPQAKQFVDKLMPERTRLTLASMGDILLMGFPCEPTGELGLKAKALARAAGWKFPLVVALTNDWLGYALMPSQYKNGGYETGMSFYGDTLGDTLLSELAKALKLIRRAGRE